MLSPEKSQVEAKEVAEWLKAGIINHVRYPTWISNPALVKNVDGTWRMCIDFKNINFAFLKDYYLVPETDLKIEFVMEGIRVNPKKTKAVPNMQSPRILKEMKSLRRKLTALSQFLARSTERCLPFFEMLKNITKDNKDEYRWTKEAEDAFQSMKRLRWFFEAHPIKFITDKPVNQILDKLESLDKLAKYLVELGAYNIAYIPRNAVKGQVLADFVIETLIKVKGRKKEFALYSFIAQIMSTTNQQTLVESGAEGRPLILEKGSYVPWASRFLRFLDNKREGVLMRNSIDNGPYIRKEIVDPKDDTNKILEPIKDISVEDKD
ncbi:hypothetical protein Tco_1008919 [Tanacetum coccineum]